jgi:ribonuclease P protein component
MKQSLSSSEIKQLFKAPKFMSGPHFNLLFCNGFPKNKKFAVLVGKKIGNSVTRNYYKRVFRHIYRISDVPRRPIGIIVKPEVKDANHKKLLKEYQTLVKKIR